jgi:superfamily II helicase
VWGALRAIVTNMIKETKILKEKIEYSKFCDVCGKKIRMDMACSAARCEYCGKDLCEDCIGHEESTDGDYRTVFCKKCNTIGDDYRPLITKLKIEIDELYDQWITKCKA